MQGSWIPHLPDATQRPQCDTLEQAKTQLVTELSKGETVKSEAQKEALPPEAPPRPLPTQALPAFGGAVEQPSAAAQEVPAVAGEGVGAEEDEIPLVLNMLSGINFPIGKCLMWIGCWVLNYDIALSKEHDLRRPDVREDIEGNLDSAAAAASAMVCSAYSRARDQACRP